MTSQPISLLRGQNHVATIRVELGGAPLDLSTASAATFIAKPSEYSPAVKITKTLGSGVAAGATGSALITITTSDAAALDISESYSWTLTATIDGTAAVVARGVLTAIGTPQQFVDDGVDQVARDASAAALALAPQAAAATTAAHNDDHGAHGFGVYTVDQLNAFTGSNRPTGVVYCSDCLTTGGFGSPVVWTGSQWVSTCASVPATTDYLTFFRALRNAGVAVAGKKTATVFPRPQRFGASWAGVAGTGSGIGVGGDLSTLSYDTGTTTTGYSTAATFNNVASLLSRPSAGVKPVTTAAYYAADSFLSALSDSTQEFAVVQGMLDSNGANTLSTATIAFVTDRGNALGIGNTGNSANMFAVCRSSSTNTVIDCGVALTASQDSARRLEILLISESAKFYADGVLVAEITTNIPTLASSGQARSLIVKSAGTTPRVLRVSDEFFGIRYA